MTESFGEMLSVLRRRTKLSLTKFCELNGFDAGNMSRLESGKSKPPRPEKLREYAAALGLKEGSGVWHELFDRAAAERGECPADILQNPDLLEQLPTLFRSLRQATVPEGTRRAAPPRDTAEYPLADDLPGLGSPFSALEAS
jgi:transcriptional regulator with XRE-family HTH domain